MTDEETRRLLLRLETEARERPGWHRARIAFYAALGYFWFVVVLAPTLLAIGAMVYFARAAFSSDVIEFPLVYAAALVGLIILLGMQLRAFLVEDGGTGLTELKRDAFPKLYQVIDDVQRGMGARCQLRVYLTPFFNAGIADAHGSMLPRFGRANGRLCLGAPMLLCLTATELRVVLTHELAHFQNRHCRFSAWVYRLFRRLDNAVQMDYRGHNPLRKLGQRYLTWYAPFFAVRTIPLRRIHEFESDCASARLEGVAATAQTLANIAWNGNRFERHVEPSILGLAAAQAVPPNDFLEQATAHFDVPPEPGEFAHWKRGEGVARSRIDDEHPCLVERLDGIGAEKDFLDALDIVAIPPTPADRSLALLSDDNPVLVSQVNQIWRCAIMDRWRERRAYLDFLKTQINAAKEKPEENPDTDDDNDNEWMLLSLGLQGLGKEAHLARLTAFLEAKPRHAPAAFCLGQTLLCYGDREGIPWLEHAMEWDYRRVAPGLEMVQAFHRQRGDDEAADAVARRIEENDQLLEKARQERTRIETPEKLTTHDLDEKTLWSIRNRLALSPRIERAWIARQQVEHHAKEKHYVVILEFHRSLYDTTGEHRTRITTSLQANLPIACTVFPSGKVSRKLVNSMRAVSRAPVYIQNS